MDSIRPPQSPKRPELSPFNESPEPPRQSPNQNLASDFVNDSYSSEIKEEIYLTSDDLATENRPEFFQPVFRYRVRHGIIGAAIIISLLILSGIGYFSWKIHHVSRSITIENNGASNPSWMSDMKSIFGSLFKTDRIKLAGEQDGRINILLLGRSGENNPGKNLTDTIMVASIDTQNKRVAFLSLPRDLYVRIPETQSYGKINSLLQYSLNQHQDPRSITQAIESITGIPIQYYVILDFTGFQKVIDDIGGVTVTVERDLYDPRYPGPNYSYETFEIKKGTRHLDGATALKYARERHADPDGDFGRARRQQQILQAVKNKVFSAGTMLNVFAINRLLTTLETHIQTNIKIEEAESFMELTKTLDTQNITNAVVDAWEKESLLRVSHVYYNDVRAFILVPRAGNFSEIQDLAQNIFDQNRLKVRRDSIQKEEAQIVLTNESNDNQLAEKVRRLLKDELDLKDVAITYQRSSEKRDNTTIEAAATGAKPFTLDELIKRIPATVGANISSEDEASDKTPDFVIRLGNDIVDDYKYDRDSVDDYRNAAPEQGYIELLNTK